MMQVVVRKIPEAAGLKIRIDEKLGFLYQARNQYLSVMGSKFFSLARHPHQVIWLRASLKKIKEAGNFEYSLNLEPGSAGSSSSFVFLSLFTGP
jgi:hypothetical protein